MGIQKAIVAFVMAGLGLVGYFVTIDFNIDENMVSSIVGVVLTIGTAFGVWKVENK